MEELALGLGVAAHHSSVSGDRRAGGLHDLRSGATDCLVTNSSLEVPYRWATDPRVRTGKDTLGADPKQVVLSTIHSSKGLEWRHVVLFAIFDDRPESDRSVNRRLIYVGMTRATEELAISKSGRHCYMVDMER